MSKEEQNDRSRFGHCWQELSIATDITECSQALRIEEHLQTIARCEFGLAERHETESIAPALTKCKVSRSDPNLHANSNQDFRNSVENIATYFKLM